MANIAVKVGLLGLLAASFTTTDAVAAQWADYFMPTPNIGSLSSTCWGAAQVGARDPSNGLEDKTLANWVYWDGGIIKDDQTGIYHMFASRWNQANGHNGWMGDSHCVHATSTSLYGPYTDQGLCFTDNSGLCHNVNALKLRTGDTSGKQYAITCSGSVPGSGRAYGANSLDGPWSYLGNIQLDLNGYSGQYSTGDNFRTILRPDGKYLCMNSRIGLADNVLGPYKAQMANNFTNTVPNSPTVNMEDPSIFYAGGVYHVIYHCWSSGQAYLYTSQDGLTNWKLESGIAYDPATNMVRYTDNTVDHWPLLERSSVYVENGHVVAMTFAAINVQKANDLGNDKNGSKVIVVPFDGVGYDSGAAPGTTGGAGGSSGVGGSTASTGGRTAAGGTTSTFASGGGNTSIAATGGNGTVGTGGRSVASSTGGTQSSAGGSPAGGNPSTGGRSTEAATGGAGTGGTSDRGSGGANAATGGSRAAATDSGGSVFATGGSSTGLSNSSLGGNTVATIGGASSDQNLTGAGNTSGCNCVVGAGNGIKGWHTKGGVALMFGLGALANTRGRRKRSRRASTRGSI